MKIEYATLDDFYDGINRLVRFGLTFRAYPDTLTIHLEGGF